MQVRKTKAVTAEPKRVEANGELAAAGKETINHQADVT